MNINVARVIQGGLAQAGRTGLSLPTQRVGHVCFGFAELGLSSGIAQWMPSSVKAELVYQVQTILVLFVPTTLPQEGRKGYILLWEKGEGEYYFSYHSDQAGYTNEHTPWPPDL